ncbi:thiamine phosphate synthase [Arcobacteraceae bacterium]|nr:thiamine phosphate synthase [Arcobacteraceae bacterium]
MPKQIYALCDYQTLQKFDVSLEKFLQICSSHNTVYIQYRDKINSLEIQKQNIQFLKQNTNIPIIINDKVELLKFADGIHLGQEDIESVIGNSKVTSLKVIRKKYPNKIIGLSTHNELEILEANKLDLDYIGLGAYRATNTKDVPNVLGDNISYLAQMSIHPVGAIGGVKIEDDIEHVSYNVIASGLLS